MKFIGDLLKSKTVWGLLIGVIGPVAAKYGIAEGDLQTILEGGTAVVGFLLGVYGRVKATQRIGSEGVLR